MIPALIKKWRVEDVEEFFRICGDQQQTCGALSQPLDNPSVFDSYGGYSARVAQQAGNAHRADIDEHGQEAKQVAHAASLAINEIEAAKRALQEAEDYIAAQHDPALSLDEQTGVVSIVKLLAPVVTVDDGAGRRDIAQKMVTNAMNLADRADRDLAQALRGATGQIPVSAVSASDGDAIRYPDNKLPGYPLQGFDFGKPMMRSKQQPGVTTRLLPVDVPTGWSDPNLTSDLAQQYAKTIHFDPKDPTTVGHWSDDVLTHVNSSDLGGADISNGKFDANFKQQWQVRVDSAQPTGMHEVTVNGKNYLAIDYRYNYSAQDQINTNVNGFNMPSNPHWTPASQTLIDNLQSQGVPVPNPEAGEMPQDRPFR